ncbi:MAG: Hpt domain-containing protein [Planctomycetota bacterium]
MASSSGDRSGGAGLDAAALDNLRRQGGDELLGQLLASFHARTPERLAGARRALAADDRDEALRLIHSLKSSAALVGAGAIRSLARQAEEQARAGTPELGSALDRIEREFAQLLPDLTRRLEGTPR